jgi:FAD/FMN-containing dehydrogenase
MEPYCIIQPKDSNAVSISIKIIGFYNVKFAIRSGGHSPNPGFSSINQGGILLNMKGLANINLNEDASIASLGPGARWGDVTDVMDSNSIAVVGGRLNTIGVGGLMLGGKLCSKQKFNGSNT